MSFEIILGRNIQYCDKYNRYDLNFNKVNIFSPNYPSIMHILFLLIKNCIAMHMCNRYYRLSTW